MPYTLFLDRDGVINRRLKADYVKNWSEFEFMPHIREVLLEIHAIFPRILVVTNQQGIGKGLMSEKDLFDIHEKMLTYLNEDKVLINRVYHCPALKSQNNPKRKPAIGMALSAKNDFPDIDFSYSLMIGDSLSDMQFGRNTGMKTLFFGNDPDEYQGHENQIDIYAADWLEVKKKVDSLIF
jgi:D-glycero-D-manno-heptose 1,7-bisphosphate phosphatase